MCREAVCPGRGVCMSQEGCVSCWGCVSWGGGCCVFCVSQDGCLCVLGGELCVQGGCVSCRGCVSWGGCCILWRFVWGGSIPLYISTSSLPSIFLYLCTIYFCIS